MQTYTNRGFTLVETLVAIAILLLVIIGPITIAQKGIQNAYFANEQMTAVFLAQEAIEATRKLRDDVALDAYRVTGSITNTMSWVPVSCTNGCAYIAGQSTPFVACSSPGANQCNLYVDPYNDIYTTNNTGVSSKFTRKVYINPVGADAVEVKVEVVWNGRIFNNTNRSVVLQSYIYNHYARYDD